MNTLVGARSARPVPRISTTEELTPSLPCAQSPDSWDVDVAHPAELIAAAEQCVGCPIFARCKRDAQAGAAASMVWAGTIYDENGRAVHPDVARTWTRHRRWIRSASVTTTDIAS